MQYNPWKGCRPYSDGCKNCYFYGSYYGKERKLSSIEKSDTFDRLIAKDLKGNYKVKPNSMVYLSFNSDFFLEEADPWRDEIWSMIKIRSDLNFLFLTKRIERFYECIPADWGVGYSHVQIGCTCENQEAIEKRLPIFLEAPIQQRYLICSPLLEEINLDAYDLKDKLVGITAGGESGVKTRVCHHGWVLKLRESAIKNNLSFWFKQTGTNYVKDGVLYTIGNKLQHAQARKANLNIE